MPNGKDYILFYLKLLLESIDHEGQLRFSDTIPYNEQMLSVITNTNIDVVRSAMDIFKELNMIDIFDDQTIYMAEVNKLIGSETTSAERVRKHRQSQKLLQCNADVTKCNTELEKEKEKEYRERVVEVESDVVNNISDDTSQIQCLGGTLGKGVVFLTEEQEEALLDKLGLEGFNRYVEKLADFIINKDANVTNHYKTILKWYEEDTKV